MIEPENKTIPVKAQCDLIALPRSTYYDNCGATETERANPDKVLMDLIDGYSPTTRSRAAGKWCTRSEGAKAGL
ncbi:MAG TPA: hypothetical protein VLM37_03750 [Fibrobacteraceae bacterium]|nr:hypothetical protein [Fibrobacteraceae bacterium]